MAVNPESVAAATASAAAAVSMEGERHEQAIDQADAITFKVVFKKQTNNITMGKSQLVGELKDRAHDLTGVPVSMMKLMFKGMLKDNSKTLAEVGIGNGAKLMVVGSTIEQVLGVTAPVDTSANASATSATGTKKTKLCESEKHKKIIAKGKPDDVLVGIRGQNDPLPAQPLTGMVNSINGKVRLTFKLEQDELWIGTKVRTDKIPMGQIQSILAEPIDGHEEYHLMGLQLGTTEHSRYWVYWVPSQYVRAIKSTVLGQ